MAKTAPEKRAPAAPPAALADAIEQPSNALPRLIYKPELLALIGVSYSSIFAWMRAGRFPLAIVLGPGGRSTKIAWLESEVTAWLSAPLDARGIVLSF